MSYNRFPSGGGSGGGVIGPASSTDMAIARWDGVGGDTLQNSVVIVDDTGNITLAPSITGSASASGTLTLVSTSNGTKGKIIFGTSAYDEVNNRLGVGTASPATAVQIVGTLRVDVADNEYILRVNGTGSGIQNVGSNYLLFLHAGSEYFNLSDQTSAAQLQASGGRDLSLGVNGAVSGQKTFIKKAGGQNGNLLEFQGDTGTGLAAFTSTGQFGVGTVAPATSAAVEIASTTGSLLLPRMTTTQRDALTPLKGMVVYNTSTDKFQGYNGAWVDLN